MKNKKLICHVCGKEKKPYTVFITDDIMSLLQYEQAREDGEICQRCDQFYAMTGEFKNATKKEFEVAKKSSWLANMMVKWWCKGGKLNEDEVNKRDWEGTKKIASWCRDELSSSEKQK